MAAKSNYFRLLCLFRALSDFRGILIENIEMSFLCLDESVELASAMHLIIIIMIIRLTSRKKMIVVRQ